MPTRTTTPTPIVADVQATLREADWRFLLPTAAGGAFEHLVLLGGTKEHQRWVQETGFARRVSTVVPLESSADALVVLHDADTPLGDALPCLAPGGVLYYEANRRSAGRSPLPGRVARAIRSEGLSISGIYWVRPNFQRRQAYVPLDHPKALGWYLTHHPDTNLLQRLVGNLLHYSRGIGSGALSVRVRCYAITATMQPSAQQLPSVLGTVSLPPDLNRQQLRPILLTYGRAHWDWPRVVFLPFNGNRDPVAVLKCPRSPEWSGDTENEQAVLKSLQENLKDPLASTVPQPLGLFRWRELPVSAESLLPGGELKTFTLGPKARSRELQISELRRAAAWLTEFNRQAVVKRVVWDEQAIAEYIDEPLARYGEIFDLTQGEQLLFEDVRAYALTLRGTPLPITRMHGDFGPKNVHAQGKRIVVLDWANGRSAPPLFDLLHFVNVWYYFVRHPREDGDPLRCFRDLFFERQSDDRDAAEVHSTIRACVESLDIDPKYFRILLVMVWVDFALFNVQGRMWKQTQSVKCDIRQAKKFVQFTRIIAEHREEWRSTQLLP